MSKYTALGMLKDVLSVIWSGAVDLVIGAIYSLVCAIPVYFLWNWLMPTIFGVKLVTFWQAWGICLAVVLFKTLLSGSSSSSSKE